MFHVDNNSAVPVMPAVKPVVSAVTSFFTEGGNGVPPTYPGPDWFNIIQSELLAVLAAAGITPDKANNVQLLAAMRALFLDTSQNGADIQDKALFLQNLGLTTTGQGTQSMMFSGPGGLKIQILRRELVNGVAGVVTDNSVNFPVAFPGGFWGVWPAKLTWPQVAVSCESITNSGFNARTVLSGGNVTTTSTVIFLAVGY